MDLQIIAQLEAAGLALHGCHARHIQLSCEGKIQPQQGDLFVTDGARAACICPKPISQLFVGNVRPPILEKYPSQYLPFFYRLDKTMLSYGTTRAEFPHDRELERVLKQLARRPDGWDRNPLFSYLRSAAQLHLSLSDVSRHEFEAVVRRLARAAKTMSMGSSSCNYLTNLASRHKQTVPAASVAGGAAYRILVG